MVVSDKQLMVLIIMDGWGVAPAGPGNAITLAHLPFYKSLVKKYSYTTLKAHSKYVGLPPGQDGNSEAGHMNIGAGRIVEQDSVVISRSINNGTFFRNPAFIQAVRHATEHKSDVHLIGLFTADQSAHSDPDHLISLITLFKHSNIKNVYLHLFTDGRDSPPKLAKKIFSAYGGFFSHYAKMATIMGRFYGMDRKKEWTRTEKAYNAILLGQGIKEHSAAEAIDHAYQRGESDEFIQPTIMIDDQDKPVGLLKDNDTVVFFNLRSDRARQLCKPFVQQNFETANKHSFKREKVLKNVFFVAMTDFGPDLGQVITAFPSRDLTETLPMVLKGYRQLAIAESEKYAHVTYFFNGGYADPVVNEDRVIVRSPDLKHYEVNPAMSLPLMTDKVFKAIEQKTHDFVVMNIANADMIAHTGSLSATVEAVEVVDKALARLIPAVLQRDGVAIVTGDHGNAEEVADRQTGLPDTEHSGNPVPFILVRSGAKVNLRKNGVLGDIGPTILEILQIQQPELMTGKSLLIKKGKK